MSKQQNKLNTFLGKASDNRKLYVFLFCLFLATFFWLLNSLGNQYNSEIICNVVYKNQPKDKVVLNELPKQFKIKVRGLGFDLLGLKMSFKNPEVIIDLKRVGNISETQNISVTKYATLIANQLGDKIDIKSIYPNSIKLDVDDYMEKIVKVIPKSALSFEQQYQLFGDVLVKPVVTKISGPKSVIDTINEVYSQLIKKVNLNETITETVGFNEQYSQLKIEFNPKKVLVYIPVEKFTETTKTVHINTINVPDSITLKTIPQEVKIKFLLPLSKMANLASIKFKAEVDYNNMQESFSHKLKVEVVKAPDYIQNITITPLKVEYIIKK